ncbi:enterotoxin Yent1 [Staphylococcus aureus]|nr:enterotoxin Yent1 [Staphylococcus aureus]CAC8830197.1 enterotoxin Yent1 [Staphylococcus aureus]CAC8834051.1 enterotoxin Yent1 [Staphylococcus aureus]CAC8834442.1 enterotoxin Yent1 [Staphylococcus aureus]CAC8836754.1 enterotoxin Yent1 [Staphylococcus aureus]
MKLFAFIFICVKSCSLLFMLNGNPKPEQLNKASEFTGLMDNMRYLYDDKHVSETNIKSQEKFLQHDLLFKINGSKILKTEFKSSPDSCVKCYTMFLPFLLIKIDVFS